MNEMPELDITVMTIALNRATGEVVVDYEGMNFLEAIGILTVARNQVQDEPFFAALEGDMDEDI